jgi:MFS family permease
MQGDYRPSSMVQPEQTPARAEPTPGLGDGSSPGSERFFYGWIIVAISMIAGFLGSGVSNITMAVMLKPISEDLGWSRGITALAITMGSVAGGVLSPLFGPVVDRYGPRLLLSLGAAAVGFLALGIGFSSETWQFYASYVPARALTEFLLIGLVPMTAITNWFYARRPRAMGLVAMSVPLGSAALSLGYQFLIERYGWRSAFVVLAVALWLFVVIPAWFFMRRRPEDLGLRPDGVALLAAVANKATSQDSAEFSWQLRNALRTSSLWYLVTGLFLAQIGAGGVGFHLMAYFTDVGIAPMMAAGVLSVMAFAGAFGNSLWGAAAERVHPRLVAVLTLLLSAAAVALLTQAHSPVMAYACAIFFGFHARCTPVLLQILMARYYGRRYFGAISSVLDPFHKCGLGLGALIAGIAYDLTGRYEGVFLGFVVCYLCSGTLIFLAGPPRVRINQRRLRARLEQIRSQPAYNSVAWEQWFAERRRAKGANQPQFEQKYRDQRVVWTGIVSSIQEKWDGTVTVYVKKEDSQSDTAFFKFAAKDAAAALELSKYSRITVTGVFDTMIVNPFFRESQILGYALEPPREPPGESNLLRAL